MRKIPLPRKFIQKFLDLNLKPIIVADMIFENSFTKIYNVAHPLFARPANIWAYAII
jgi:hypothetical protein